MKRINVTFYDETYEQLETRMRDNNSKSVAHSVRELVDLGLKIEKAAKKNDQNNEDDTINILIQMLKNNLTWSLETRLLARYVVEHMPNSSLEKQSVILETYKEKSINYIEGMLKEQVK